MAIDPVISLEKGTRVKRRHQLNDPQSWRYGIIDKVYQAMPDGKGNRETLFAVCWDDTKVVERGYLAISLVALPPAQPPIMVPTAWMPPK